MKNLKRNRSKSQKRKKTVSADRKLDETLLIKLLDERARNKKVKISKEELTGLKDCKEMLKSLKEEFENEKNF